MLGQVVEKLPREVIEKLTHKWRKQTEALKNNGVRQTLGELRARWLRFGAVKSHFAVPRNYKANKVVLKRILSLRSHAITLLMQKDSNNGSSSSSSPRIPSLVQIALSILAKQRADLPSETLRADLPPGMPEHLADDVYSKEILERANRLKQQSSQPQSGNDRRHSESLKEFSRLVYSSELLIKSDQCKEASLAELEKLVPSAAFWLLRSFNKDVENKKSEWKRGQGDQNLNNWYDEKWRKLVNDINDTRGVAEFRSSAEFIINFPVLYDILYNDLKKQGLNLPVQRKVATPAQRKLQEISQRQPEQSIRCRHQ